jgi:hypothetical protein
MKYANTPLGPKDNPEVDIVSERDFIESVTSSGKKQLGI